VNVFGTGSALNIYVTLTCDNCAAGEYGQVTATRTIALASAPVQPRSAAHSMPYTAVAALSLEDILSGVRAGTMTNPTNVYTDLTLELKSTAVGTVVDTITLIAISNNAAGALSTAFDTGSLEDERKKLLSTTSYDLVVSDTNLLTNTRTYSSIMTIGVPYSLALSSCTSASTDCISSGDPLNAFFDFAVPSGLHTFNIFLEDVSTMPSTTTTTQYTAACSGGQTTSCTFTSGGGTKTTFLVAYGPADKLKIQLSLSTGPVTLYAGTLGQ